MRSFWLWLLLVVVLLAASLAAFVYGYRVLFADPTAISSVATAAEESAARLVGLVYWAGSFAGAALATYLIHRGPPD